MKTLIAALFFFNALMLSFSVGANQSIDESPSVLAVEQPEVVAVSEVFVDGQVYALDQGVIFLKPGQERKFGGTCVEVNVSLFELERACAWKKMIKATDAGLVVMPGGVTIKLHHRLGKLFAVVFVIISLFGLYPSKEVRFVAMIIFATFSFFGILGSVSEGSWVWSLLFFLNLVGALVAMTDTPPRGYSYFRRMSAVVLAMTVFVLAP